MESCQSEKVGTLNTILFHGIIFECFSPEVLWTQNRHSIALTVMVQNDTNMAEECISATESSIQFRSVPVPTNSKKCYDLLF